MVIHENGVENTRISNRRNGQLVNLQRRSPLLKTGSKAALLIRYWQHTDGAARGESRFVESVRADNSDAHRRWRGWRGRRRLTATGFSDDVQPAGNGRQADACALMGSGVGENTTSCATMGGIPAGYALVPDIVNLVGITSACHTNARRH